jgi:hypothetical protein
MEEIDKDAKFPRPPTKSVLGCRLNEVATAEDPKDQASSLTLVEPSEESKHPSRGDK